MCYFEHILNNNYIIIAASKAPKGKTDSKTSSSLPSSAADVTLAKATGGEEKLTQSDTAANIAGKSIHLLSVVSLCMCRLVNKQYLQLSRTGYHDRFMSKL